MIAKLKRSLSNQYYRSRIRFLFPYLRALVADWTRPFSDSKPSFIVFAQGRSGSTILVDLINKLPDVHCDGEVLGASLPIRLPFRHAYLRGLQKQQPASIYGYRIKVYDLVQTQGFSWEENMDFLHQIFHEDVKVIHLIRRNKFRQSMSSLIAEARGQYHDFTEHSGTTKLTVDATSIPKRIRLLEYFSEMESQILQGHTTYEVSYENDLLDPTQHQRVLDEIASFLGTSSAKAETIYKRSTSNDLEEMVANWDEVAQVIKENHLTHFYPKVKESHG